MTSLTSDGTGDATQTELFVRSDPQPVSPASPHQPSVVVRTARGCKPAGTKQLQHLLWSESLLAVRLSLTCDSVAELRRRLIEEMPQNSITTRIRNASVVLGRLFPERSLDRLPRLVWQAYADPELLAAVVEPLLLLAEPILGRLVAERLHPLAPGTQLPTDYFQRYAQEACAANVRDTTLRCSAAARTLGWIGRQGFRAFRLAKSPNPTAALLVLHHHYAPTPRIIDLKQVWAEPVWQYLGFATPDEVRTFFADLERTGLVARWVQVDRLEQVTTRYSLPELLRQKVRP